LSSLAVGFLLSANATSACPHPGVTLLLADGEDARYERAALRWHARFVYETKNVDIRESVAVLALLTTIPANRLAAAALAELFSRRRSLERCAEALVRWARTA
jgi:hypothetical protein